MARVKYMTIAKGKQIGIDQYPNFSATGNVRGMKKLYYGSKAYLVHCGSWIYNVPFSVYEQA